MQEHLIGEPWKMEGQDSGEIVENYSREEGLVQVRYVLLRQWDMKQYQCETDLRLATDQLLFGYMEKVSQEHTTQFFSAKHGINSEQNTSHINTMLFLNTYFHSQNCLQHFRNPLFHNYNQSHQGRTICATKHIYSQNCHGAFHRRDPLYFCRNQKELHTLLFTLSISRQCGSY